MLSIMFFVLMQQTHAWEVDASVPSVLHSLEMNLRLKAFLLLSCVPVILCVLYSFLVPDQLSSVTSFVSITLLCYLVANGLVILVVFVSKWIFYLLAVLHVLLKRRLVLFTCYWNNINSIKLLPFVKWTLRSYEKYPAFIGRRVGLVRQSKCENLKQTMPPPPIKSTYWDNKATILNPLA